MVCLTSLGELFSQPGLLSVQNSNFARRRRYFSSFYSPLDAAITAQPFEDLSESQKSDADTRDEGVRTTTDCRCGDASDRHDVRLPTFKSAGFNAAGCRSWWDSPISNQACFCSENLSRRRACSGRERKIQAFGRSTRSSRLLSSIK